MRVNGVITVGRRAGEISEEERGKLGKEVAEQVQWF